MLHLDRVCKNFGGLAAVWNVSLNLGDACITGLVGPNGSGKTTLFHLISGFYHCDAGTIVLDDSPIQDLPPHEISRMGLIRTFQHSRVLPFLSVRDNILIAAPQQLGESVLPLFFRAGEIHRQEQKLRKEADEILRFLTMSHLADQPAERLSYGQQKLLELGRVLMAHPRLVLLDEPTAGVNPTLIRQIVGLIRQLAEQGIRFFLVEHNMSLVAELCERVFVMDAGTLIFEGTPEEARKDPRVIEAYLGKVNVA